MIWLYLQILQILQMWIAEIVWKTLRDNFYADLAAKRLTTHRFRFRGCSCTWSWRNRAANKLIHKWRSQSHENYTAIKPDRKFSSIKMEPHTLTHSKLIVFMRESVYMHESKLVSKEYVKLYMYMGVPRQSQYFKLVWQ